MGELFSVAKGLRQGWTFVRVRPFLLSWSLHGLLLGWIVLWDISQGFDFFQNKKKKEILELSLISQGQIQDVLQKKSPFNATKIKKKKPVPKKKQDDSFTLKTQVTQSSGGVKDQKLDKKSTQVQSSETSTSKKRALKEKIVDISPEKEERKAKENTVPGEDLSTLLKTVHRLQKDKEMEQEKDLPNLSVVAPSKEEGKKSALVFNIKKEQTGVSKEGVLAKEIDLIAQHISSYWNINPGIFGVTDMLIILRVTVDAQGYVENVENRGDQKKYSHNKSYQSVVDGAIRAVYMASPLPLPEGKAGLYKKIEISFRPKYNY